MRPLITAILSMGVSITPLTAFAGFILNGSFEQPVVDSETQFFDGQTIGAGWTVLSGDTAYIITDGSNQGVTPFGNQFLEIHADTVIQVIDGLTAGSMYELAYYASASSNSNYFGSGQITAMVGGQSDLFAYTLNGENLYGSSTLPWTLRQLRFTASSSTEVVSFSASGGLNDQPLAAIDNVNVTAVPEPSTILLRCSRHSLCSACEDSRTRRTV